MGISLFTESLTGQGIAVDPVAWHPPPTETEADLAAVIADPRRAAANALAVKRMLRTGAELVDVRPAAEVLGLVAGRVPARRAADRVGCAPPVRFAGR